MEAVAEGVRVVRVSERVRRVQEWVEAVPVAEAEAERDGERVGLPEGLNVRVALQLAVGLLALYELSLLTPASAAGLRGVVALAALRWVRPAAGAAPAR